MRDGRFLFLDFAVCFEELIEQQRVHLVIAYAGGTRVFISFHRIGFELETARDAIFRL
jgi:hypothetical protein